MWKYACAIVHYVNRSWRIPQLGTIGVTTGGGRGDAEGPAPIRAETGHGVALRIFECLQDCFHPNISTCPPPTIPESWLRQ